MRNLLEFESFDPLYEASLIPVYNSKEFERNPSIKPESSHRANEIVSGIQNLIDRMEMGEVATISVIADIPSQGKRTPKYAKDIIDMEKRRIAERMAKERGKEITNPEELEFDRYGNKRDIFLDSEFVVDGVVQRPGSKDHIIGIPISFYKKAMENDEARKYYSVEIYPDQIEEVYYNPA